MYGSDMYTFIGGFNLDLINQFKDSKLVVIGVSQFRQQHLFHIHVFKSPGRVNQVHTVLKCSICKVFPAQILGLCGSRHGSPTFHQG